MILNVYLQLLVHYFLQIITIFVFDKQVCSDKNNITIKLPTSLKYDQTKRLNQITNKVFSCCIFYHFSSSFTTSCHHLQLETVSLMRKFSLTVCSS